MTDVLLYVVMASGLIGAGCYVYGFIMRPAGFRPKLVVALAMNVMAIWQIGMGIALNGPVNVKYGLGFLALGTIALAASAVGRRNRNPVDLRA
ncbi:MAG: hypothetical protein BGN86_06975 [Caulobacterales bacterium 68-7]|nr:MAG: hypothetical protein BGN86_06975 [Caulobacterales bacterium 68-7]